MESSQSEESQSAGRRTPQQATGSGGPSRDPPRPILKRSPDSPTCLSPDFSNPQLYRGVGGKLIDVTSNYFKLDVEEGFGVFEYEVNFNPNVDSRDERYSVVNQQKSILGLTKSFDGNKLFLPKKLKDKITQVISKHSK